MRRPLLSCLSREGSRAMLGLPAPASATAGEQAGPSDTMVALLGASRLCPSSCSRQSSARGEATLIQRNRQRLQDQMRDKVSCPLPSHHPGILGVLGILSPWAQRYCGSAPPLLGRPTLPSPMSPRKGLNLHGSRHGLQACGKTSWKAWIVGNWGTLGTNTSPWRGWLCHTSPRPGASLTPRNPGSILFFSFSPCDTHPTAYPNVSRRCQLLVHKCILGKKLKQKKKKKGKKNFQIITCNHIYKYINIY